MKNLHYLTVILIFGLMGCSGNRTPSDLTIDTRDKTVSEQIAVLEAKDSAYFKLNESVFDFGTVKEKKVKNIVLLFDVENQGKTPLVIFNGDVSCKCLSVEHMKKPILYGEKQQLKVNINTTGQKGNFNKVIYFTSNATNARINGLHTRLSALNNVEPCNGKCWIPKQE